MMEAAKMEYKGKDVDEAIGNACVGLNVSREALDIRIISTGSAGIFGLGRKKAVIRVSLRDAAGAGVKKAARRARPRAPESEEGEPVGEPLPRAELEEIKKDLLHLLDLMGCPSEVTIAQNEKNKVHLQIEGEYLDLLTGPEGQTLDALQYMLRKLVSRKFPQKVALDVDAGDFRASRKKELEEKALALAQEVKATGKTRIIPAINPAERRIVHMTLQGDTAIRSRSVGDGLFKKVLIYLPGKSRKRGPRRHRTNDRQKK